MKLTYQWESHFFGLREDYKLVIQDECFVLSFYGRGAFSFMDAYRLPIHLRKFHLKKLEKIIKKEKSEKGKTTKGGIARVPKFAVKPRNLKGKSR